MPTAILAGTIACLAIIVLISLARASFRGVDKTNFGLRSLRKRVTALLLFAISINFLLIWPLVSDFLSNSILAVSEDEKNRAEAGEQFYRTALRLRFHNLTPASILCLEAAQCIFEKSGSQLNRPGIKTELLHIYRLLGKDGKAKSIEADLTTIDPFVLQYYYLSCKGKYSYSLATLPCPCGSEEKLRRMNPITPYTQDYYLLRTNKYLAESVVAHGRMEAAAEYPYETAAEIDLHQQMRQRRIAKPFAVYGQGIQCPGTIRLRWSHELEQCLPFTTPLFNSYDRITERIESWYWSAESLLWGEPNQVFERN